MISLEFLALVVGGGLGAGARYLADGAVMKGRTDAFPLGIVLVNVSGSFVLGVLTGVGSTLSPAWLAILGIGVLGGFTTFSAVAVETVLLAEAGRRQWAWLNLLGTLGLAVVAAALGIMIGGLFPR